MAYKYDILIGRITKVSGYEGAVAIKLEKIFIENIPPMESVFLEIEGRPVPFFIDDIDYSGADILRLHFEGYDTNQKVNEFVGCRVFLTSGLDEGYSHAKDPGITGYKVFAAEDKLLGIITEVVQNPGQWLLTVKSADKKELLIPFHEDLIVSIDKKKKIIVMDIPEGLTEIN